jgi:hypothetical protein
MYIIAIFTRHLDQILLVNDAQVFGTIYMQFASAYQKLSRVNLTGC